MAPTYNPSFWKSRAIAANFCTYKYLNMILECVGPCLSNTFDKTNDRMTQLITLPCFMQACIDNPF